MTMSKDRVRFFIGYRYFENSNYGVLQRIIRKAFEISVSEFEDMAQGSGFWVTCRPSQFARFLIYRNEADLKNGFIDLRAKLVQTKPDVYKRLGQALRRPVDLVRAVTTELGLSRKDVEELFNQRVAESAEEVSRELDVSTRSHKD